MVALDLGSYRCLRCWYYFLAFRLRCWVLWVCLVVVDSVVFGGFTCGWWFV